jgi:hypothetical protein
MAHYNKIQLIAYHVPTDKALKAGNACILSSDKSKDFLKEMGYLKKMSSDDARNRLLRMVAVVEKARASTHIGDKDTLKVFMAPEFYFQPFMPGNYDDPASWENLPPRCYPEEDKHLIVSALFGLFGEQEEWTDWLFAFGTIIWETKAKKLFDNYATIFERKKAKNSGKDSTQANADSLLTLKSDTSSADNLKSAKGHPVVFNTAVLVMGGHGILTLNKQNYADCDKILPKYGPWVKNDAYKSLPNDAKEALAKYLASLTKIDPKDCLTRVADNLSATIEICIDHDNGMVAKAYADFERSWGTKNKSLQKDSKDPCIVLPDVPVIDIQLLTCCGMPLRPRNVVVPKGRFALRCDGISVGMKDEFGKEWSRSEVGVVTGFTNNKTPTIKSTSTPKLSIELAGDLALDFEGLTVKVMKGNDVETKNLKDVFKQEIFIYEPMAIAQLNRNNNSPLQNQVVPKNQVATK